MLIPLRIVFVGSGHQNLGTRNVFPFSPIGMKRFSSYLHWSKEEYICYRLQYATLKPFREIHPGRSSEAGKEGRCTI